MERTSSTFVRDIVVEGEKKVLLGISSRLTSAEYILPSDFYTFVLVFRRNTFEHFLAGTGVTYTLHQEELTLRSCNKNLLQCMFDCSEFNRSGVLMCITTRAYKDFKQINDVLYRNSAHVDLYAYNPQSASLLFSEALHFSVKQRNFQFRAIAARWVDLVTTGADKWSISAFSEVQENILERLPRLSFDLETLATNEVAFPLGIFEEEKIASASIMVEYRAKRYHYMFLLAPWQDYDAETTRRYLAEKVDSRFVAIFVYATELELVESLFTFLYCGMPLIPFSLDPDTVTIVTGYNILNFDIPYLYRRLYFHGKEAYAHRLSLKHGWRKNILLDMFVVEKNHFSHAIGTNFKLSNVVNVFIKEEKLDIEIAAIRRLYREHRFDVNSCNTTVSVGGVNTPSVNYTCWYNLVDSQLVLNLINAQNVVTLMFVQSRDLNHAIDGILSVRNARALASSINIFMFERGYFFSRGPPTIIFPRITRLFSSEADKFCKILQEIDRGEFVDMVRLLRGDTAKDTEHDSDDEDFVDADGEAVKIGGKGGFGGGANFARRGCFRRLASMDFTSLYATIKLYARIDFNNVSIVTARVLMQRPASQLEALVVACNLYVYDHPDIEVFMRDITVRGQLMEIIDKPQRINELHPDTRILIILPTRDAVLSGLVQHLIDSRNQCKLQYANDPTNVLAKTNELTLKQRTCAIFGCLGFEHFEASSPCSAAAITALARQFIILASHFLAQLQLETIYIDTDGLIFFFDGGMDELKQLSAEITKRLNAPPIHLKPEHVYPIGIVASKKKYILQMEDGSVKINGFLKWAIEPVQVVVRAWFAYLLSTVPRNAVYREFRWKVEPEEVVVACFTELEQLWKQACALVRPDDPQHGHGVHLKKWQMFVKINKRSPTEAIAAFSRDMRDVYGVVEDGTRVAVYKILDDGGKSCMLYADGATAVHCCHVDVRALLLSVLAYVLNFTLCPEKPAPGVVDRAWVRFSTGARRRFNEVTIVPEEVRWRPPMQQYPMLS